MLESSKINFKQASVATEINSTMYYSSSSGLVVENLNSTGGKNIIMNSNSNIKLQTTDEVILIFILIKFIFELK